MFFSCPSQNLAERKNTIISKCSLLKLERRGEKTLSPNEDNLSTAALVEVVGKLVFSAMNSF